MTSETLVAPTWRLFELARTATTTLGLLAVLAGCGGRFLSQQPRRQARARRLALGGSVALVCVVSLEFVYRAISWAVAGSTGSLSPASALLPDTARSSGLYAASDADGIVPLSTVGVVARTAAVSGLVAVCSGGGIWALSTTNGNLRASGVRATALGVALLVVSVGADLFAGINYALGVGWSG